MMDSITHIRTSKKTYYGVIIFSFLFISYQNYSNNESFLETVSSTVGIITTVVIFFSFYKIFFGKGKIILSESGFKIQGYDWTSWDEFTAVYPFVEQDSENGEQHFIRFRLMDGTDLTVRSEYLEKSFEQIAELVNRYKLNYNNGTK